MRNRKIPPWEKPLAVLIALGLSFFGSLALAAHFFPHPYHWTRTVMSSLASPRDNPHAYAIACTGLALSGLCLIPFGVFLERRLSFFSPRGTAWAGRFFLIGAIFLTLSALIVPGHYRILSIGRSHEHLAQISGTAFCLSLVLYLVAVLRLPSCSGYLRLSALFLVALPVTALLVSRISLVLAYEFLSHTDYLAIRSSVWNSLALWEWIGAVCIYLFLAVMTLGLLETSAPSSGD